MNNDLISREAALEAIHNLQTAFGWGNGLHEMDIHKVLLKIPAVDAAPVVHGRWTGNYRSHCSVCDWFDVNAFIGNYTKFCPNCGAKMDKEEEA